MRMNEGRAKTLTSHNQPIIESACPEKTHTPFNKANNKSGFIYQKKKRNQTKIPESILDRTIRDRKKMTIQTSGFSETVINTRK